MSFKKIGKRVTNARGHTDDICDHSCCCSCRFFCFLDESRRQLFSLYGGSVNQRVGVRLGLC